MTSSRCVANPSLSHSSVQSRAPMARPNQACAISWQRRLPQRGLLPARVLWDRKTRCGLRGEREKTHGALSGPGPAALPRGQPAIAASVPGRPSGLLLAALGASARQLALLAAGQAAVSARPLSPPSSSYYL